MHGGVLTSLYNEDAWVLTSLCNEDAWVLTSLYYIYEEVLHFYVAFC